MKFDTYGLMVLFIIMIVLLYHIYGTTKYIIIVVINIYLL